MNDKVIEGEVTVSDQAPKINTVEITDLVLVVSSEIVESNWSQVADQVTARIAAINEDLKDDADFKEAKQIAADLRQVKKDMVAKKQEALSQAEAVYELFSAIDTMSDECYKKALALEKVITKRNDDLKKEKVDASDLEINEYMKAKSGDFQAQRYGDRVYSLKGLRDCLYRKSSFTKMDEALAKYVEESKARADDFEAALDANSKRLDLVPEELKTLFQNRVELLGMNPELLDATIEKYIARHEAEELKRKEAKRIADEAEEKRLADVKAAEDKAALEAKETQKAEDPPFDPDPKPAPAQESDGLEGMDAPKTDNTPPSGFGGSSRPATTGHATGSPVPIVKAPPAAEPETLNYKVVIDLDCDAERAREIARLVHGRFSKTPGVTKVRLPNPNKAEA